MNDAKYRARHILLGAGGGLVVGFLLATNAKDGQTTITQTQLQSGEIEIISYEWEPSTAERMAMPLHHLFDK